MKFGKWLKNKIGISAVKNDDIGKYLVTGYPGVQPCKLESTALERIDSLEKRVTALEEVIQGQPRECVITVDGNKIN